MGDLFAADTTYVEPFSGTVRTHIGHVEILAAMALGWANPMLDIRICIEEARVEGDLVVLDWRCFSPAIPGGTGCGTNHFTLRDGLIARLVTTVKKTGG